MTVRQSIRTRRALAALAAVVAAAAVAPASPAASSAPPLAPRLARALAVPHVNHARSAAVAVELATGRVVFARNRALSLAPASTEKLALTYALLARVGPAYRIETEVVGEGELDGTTWRGRLVLKGYGDPTLSTARLRRLAAAVRAFGIRRVTGAIVGDESFFDGRRTAPGWKPSYYIRQSAPLSALVVDGARYRGYVTPRPALAAAATFHAALARAGVAVPGGATVGRADGEGIHVAATASPPLLHILRVVNRESDNFTSEILLKHLGALESGRGTTAAGTAAVRRVLAASRVPLAGVRLVDASGLSLLDRLTADALVAILKAAWADPLLRGSFLDSLAVAGRSGTLRRRLRAPRTYGRVFAKTGTTARASTLAGYVGGRYAFAILHNGPPISPWWCRRAQDRFVTVLAAE